MCVCGTEQGEGEEGEVHVHVSIELLLLMTERGGRLVSNSLVRAYLR